MMNLKRAARSPWLPALLAALAIGFWACRSKPAREAVAGPSAGAAGSRSAVASEVAALAAVAAGSVGDATPAPTAVQARAPAAFEPPMPPERLGRAAAAPSYLALSWAPAGPGSPDTTYEVLRGDVVVATSREPNVHFTDLRAGREHCFTVVAVDSRGGRSAPSAPMCSTLPDITAPAAPVGLAATLASPSEARLRWQAPTDDVGVTGYELERDGKVIVSTNSPAAAETSLRAGPRACYVVRALDAAGNRSPPSEPVCVDPPDVTSPSAPVEVLATGAPAQVKLTWTAAADDVGVTAYEVLRDEVRVARVATTAALESSLRPAVAYCYQVRALDAAGNRSPLTAPVCATPPDVTPPRPPAVLTARGTSESEVALAWDAASDDVGVVGYELLSQGGLIVPAGGIAATVGGFTANTRHCWTVVARDAAGNRSAPSAEACGTTLDLTPPSTPADLVVVAEGEHETSVRWSPAMDNVGVVRYELRRNQQPAAGLDAGTSATSEHGLGAGRKYCYTVVAYDQAGNGSTPGTPACVTTPDLTPPSAPPAVAAAPSSPTQLVLAWEPARDEVGVAGYEVKRGTFFTARVAQPIVAEPNLAPSTEYCYVIRAFDASGNLSSPTSPKCATTAPAGTLAGPWNLKAQPSGARGVELTWVPSPQPDVLYAVYWDGRSGNEARIGTTRGNTFRISGKAARERHCYRVVAEDHAQQVSPMTLPVCTGGGQQLSSR